MTQYRVDYETTDGERGTWYYEQEMEGGLDEVVETCRKEFQHVAEQLKSHHGKTLRKLIVVEVTERDAHAILQP